MDTYKLLCADALEIPYENVTEEMRTTAKNALFAFLYSPSRPSREDLVQALRLALRNMQVQHDY